jgi:hypothetical protein
MNHTAITQVSIIADYAHRLANELIGKSSLDHQRFAAQELKEAINNAALLINGLCSRPGPTLEERREAKKIKDVHRANTIAIPRGPGCVHPSKGHKTRKRQDVRDVGSRAGR